MSTSFCLPVKYGWHLEQISTLSSLTFLVVPVWNVFPHAHTTVTSWYWGWIPSFILILLTRFFISTRANMLRVYDIKFLYYIFIVPKSQAIGKPISQHFPTNPLTTYRAVLYAFSNARIFAIFTVLIHSILTFTQVRLSILLSSSRGLYPQVRDTAYRSLFDLGKQPSRGYPQTQNIRLRKASTRLWSGLRK